MEFLSELTNLLFPGFSSYLTGLPLIVSFLGLGMIIGFLTGFLGVGGGFLITPLLNIILGVPYELAVGSGLSFMIGTSFFGFLRQAGLKNVHYKIAYCIAGGSAVGTFAGDMLQDIVLFRFAGGNNTTFTIILHTLYILLLLVIIFMMKRKAALDLSHDPLFQKHPGKIKIFIEGVNGPAISLFALLGTGLLLGTLTGFMGVGGGVLLVPILLLFIGLKPIRASGTSIFIVFMTAVMGTFKKGLSGTPKVSLMITLCLLISSFIGVQAGINILRKAKSKTFARTFIYIVFIALGLILFDIIRNIISLL